MFHDIIILVDIQIPWQQKLIHYQIEVIIFIAFGSGKQEIDASKELEHTQSDVNTNDIIND